MQQPFKLLLLLFILLPGLRASATHVMGGDISYKIISHNPATKTVNYAVSMRFYRDCKTGTADMLDFETLYYETSNDGVFWSFVGVESLPRVKQENVTKQITGCLKPGAFCIEQHEYMDTLEFPDSIHIRFISQMCCRTSSIINILDPLSSSFVTYTYAAPYRQVKNNSSTLLAHNIPYFCAAKINVVNNNAYDQDGDSLSYTFMPVQDGIGTPAGYQAGYSGSKPLGSGSTSTIDQRTGDMTLHTTRTGMHSMLVEIREYKTINGVKVLAGYVQREMVAISIACPPDQTAQLDTNVTMSSYRVKAGEQLCFPVQSYDPDGDSVFVAAFSELLDSVRGITPPMAVFPPGTVGADSVVRVNFCWKPACHHIRKEPYLVTFRSSDSSCISASRKTISIYVDTPAYYETQLWNVKYEGPKSLRVTWYRTIPSDTSNYKGYQIYRSSNGGSTYWPLALAAGNRDSSYVDTTAINNTSTRYCYQVRFQNRCGHEITVPENRSNIPIQKSKLSPDFTSFTWMKPDKAIDSFRIRLHDVVSGALLKDTFSTDTSWSYFSNYCQRIVRLEISARHPVMGWSYTSGPALDTLRDKNPPVADQLGAVSFENGRILIKHIAYTGTRDVSKYVVFHQSAVSPAGALDSVMSTATGWTMTKDTATATNNGQFALKVADSCGNMSALSVWHRPMRLSGTPGQKSGSLSWTKYVGDTVNSILVQQWNGTAWANISSLGGTSLNTTLNNLTCNVRYSFRVCAILANGYRSYSDSTSFVPYDNINPGKPIIDGVSVTASGETNGKIEIYLSNTWSSDTWKLIVLGKAFTASTWDTIYNGVKTTLVEHNNLNTRHEFYIYKALVLDSCGNYSALTNTQQSMELLVEAENNFNHLHWTDYTGAIPFPKYTIQRKDGSASWNNIVTGLTIPHWHDTPTYCNKEYTYRIQLENPPGGTNPVYSDTVNLISFETFPPDVPEILAASVTTTGNTNGEVLVQLANRWSQDVLQIILLGKADTASTWDTVYRGRRDTLIRHQFLNTRDLRYQYQVQAMDSCANYSAFSGIHRAINLEGFAGNNANYISWSAYQGLAVAPVYTLERSEGGGPWMVMASGITATNWTDSPSFCHREYKYRIRLDNSPASIPVYSDTIYILSYELIAPLQPIVNSASFNLDWTEMDLDINTQGSNDLNYVRIFRRKNNGPFGEDTVLKVLRILPGNRIVVRDPRPVTPGTKYCYYAQGIDSCDNISPADSAFFGCSVNLKIDNLFCVPILRTNWKNPAPDSPYVRYEILRFRNGVPFPPGVYDTLIGGNIQEYYYDSNVVMGEQYSYAVRALLSDGSITWASDTVSQQPFVFPPPPLHRVFQASVEQSSTAGAIRIGWPQYDATDTLLRGYILYYSNTAAGPYNSIYQGGDTSFLHTNINTFDSAHYYKVSIFNKCDTIGPQSSLHKAPWLKTSFVNLGTRIDFIDYEGAPGPLTYTLERSRDLPDAFLPIATLNSNSYTDTVLVCGHWYYYRLHATGPNGMDVYSAWDSLLVRDTVPPLAPVFFNSSVGSSIATNDSILISWQQNTEHNRMAYVIFQAQNNGSFSPVDTLNAWDGSNIRSHWIGGLNTRDTTYAFFLTTLDSCSNMSLPSDTHRVINLDVQAMNNANRISAAHYLGYPGVRYDLEQSREGTAWNKIATGLATPDYIDTPSYCGIYYTYRFVAFNTAGTDSSYSDTTGVRSFETIPGTAPAVRFLNVLSTGTADGTLEIKWQNPPQQDVTRYQLFRTENGGSLQMIRELPAGTSSFIDSNLNTRSNVYAYYLWSIDSCNNISDSGVHHRALNLEVTAMNGYNQLNWTAYKGWIGATTYDIQEYSGSGLWNTIKTNLTDTFHRDSVMSCDIAYDYRIIARSGTEQGWSDTVQVISFEKIPTAQPPLITASVNISDQVNGSVDLQWDIPADRDLKNIHIFRAGESGTWSMVQALPETGTYTDQGINTLQESFRYKLAAVDSCGNSTDTSLNTLHRTINLKSRILDMEAYLDWNHYEGASPERYQVYKDGQLIKTLAGTVNSCKDTIDACNMFISYRVKAVWNGGTRSAWSDTTMVFVIDSIEPPGVTLLAAGYTQHDTQQVVLNWTHSAEWNMGHYEIWEKLRGTSTWKLIGSTTDTVYQFAHAKHLPHCYRIVAVDKCGNVSTESNEGCLIILEAQAGRVQNELNWLPYKDWSHGVLEYQVFWQEDKTTFLDYLDATDSLTVTYADDQYSGKSGRYYYRIKAIENNGPLSMVSYSNVVHVSPPLQVYLPNAFTPGGSPNLNDVFCPEGMQIYNATLSIFDRWGGLVWEGKGDRPCWNGTGLNGQLCDQGVYLYVLSAEGFDKKSVYYSGTITLVR